MSRHTPGPWRGNLVDSTIVIDANGHEVAAALGSYGPNHARMEANARLIAAAPEMLEALREVMGWINNWEPEFLQDDDWPAAAKRARAAIAKATGEPT